MKLKVLYTNCYYDLFLKDFYKLHPELAKRSFASQRQLLYDQLVLTSDFYPSNLAKLGCQVESLILNCQPLQAQWAKEQGIAHRYLIDKTLRKIPLIRGQFQPAWSREIFLAQVKQFRPDILFMHNINYIEPEAMLQVKRWTKLLIGQIASPLPENRYLWPYDLIVSSLPNLVQMIEKKGINTLYLPLAFEPKILKELPKSRQIYQASFIGGLSRYHSQRIRLLEQAADKIPLDIWGYGKNQLSLLSPLRKRHHGNIWGKQLYIKLLRSRITLNQHIDVAENYANNMRLFEATGVGTFLITDLKDNLSQLFKLGEEVETYSTSEELIDKVRYYLSHQTARMRIAREGQRKTLRDHTYFQRMKRLLSVLTHLL